MSDAPPTANPGKRIVPLPANPQTDEATDRTPPQTISPSQSGSAPPHLFRGRPNLYESNTDTPQVSSPTAVDEGDGVIVVRAAPKRGASTMRTSQHRTSFHPSSSSPAAAIIGLSESALKMTPDATNGSISSMFQQSQRSVLSLGDSYCGSPIPNVGAVKSSGGGEPPTKVPQQLVDPPLQTPTVAPPRPAPEPSSSSGPIVDTATGRILNSSSNGQPGSAGGRGGASGNSNNRRSHRQDAASGGNRRQWEALPIDVELIHSTYEASVQEQSKLVTAAAAASSTAPTEGTDTGQAKQPVSENAPTPDALTAIERAFPKGFTFSVFDSDISSHYNIDSSSVMLTGGSIKYIDHYEKYGPQTKFRFQLCRNYLHGRCQKGCECSYIHCAPSKLPASTSVHLNVYGGNSGLLHQTGGGDQLNHESDDMVALAAAARYECLPQGFVMNIFAPNANSHDVTESIETQSILRTLGAVTALNAQLTGAGYPPVDFHPTPGHSTGVVDPGIQRSNEPIRISHGAGGVGPRPKHCAHFQFKKMCHLGYQCHFIHSKVAFGVGGGRANANHRIASGNAQRNGRHSALGNDSSQFSLAMSSGGGEVASSQHQQQHMRQQSSGHNHTGGGGQDLQTAFQAGIQFAQTLRVPPQGQPPMMPQHQQQPHPFLVPQPTGSSSSPGQQFDPTALLQAQLQQIQLQQLQYQQLIQAQQHQPQQGQQPTGFLQQGSQLSNAASSPFVFGLANQQQQMQTMFPQQQQSFPGVPQRPMAQQQSVQQQQLQQTDLWNALLQTQQQPQQLTQ